MKCGSRFEFTFDQAKYHMSHSPVPPVSFVSNYDKNALPDFLKLGLRFTKYLRAMDPNHYFTDSVPADTPNYYNTIKHPICISTIEEKVYEQRYKSLDEFKKDVDLIWSNCVTYNSINDDLSKIALKLKSEFDEAFVLHSMIRDYIAANDICAKMEETQKVCSEMINFMIKMPSRMQKQSLPKHVVDKKKLNKSMELSVSQINDLMTTKEKYELAKDINVLPPELLGGIVEILKKDGFCL